MGACFEFGPGLTAVAQSAADTFLLPVISEAPSTALSPSSCSSFCSVESPSPSIYSVGSAFGTMDPPSPESIAMARALVNAMNRAQ